METNTVSTREVRALRVLKMLQSWSNKFVTHVTQKRSSVRKPCQIATTLIIPELRRAAGEVQDESMTDVWIRNISASGVCFIAYGPLRTSDNVVIINLGLKYIECKIVRMRQVHDGFWEYGAIFVKETTL